MVNSFYQFQLFAGQHISGHRAQHPSPISLWPLIFLFSTSAAAAAKSLQSCLTLCDLIDGSPPGSPLGFSRQEYWSGVPLPLREALKSFLRLRGIFIHFPLVLPKLNGKILTILFFWLLFLFPQYFISAFANTPQEKKCKHQYTINTKLSQLRKIQTYEKSTYTRISSKGGTHGEKAHFRH